jgi:hypothetical protein
VIGPLAFLTVSPLLYVVDVHDPTQPVGTGRLWADSGGFDLLAVDGQRLVALRFTADGQALATIDPSDPAHPRQLGAVNLPGLMVRSLAAGGGYAYALDSDGVVQAVDLRDPARPALAWQTGSPGLAMAVAWAPGRLYLAGMTVDLMVFDLSDPGSPVLSGMLDDGGSRVLVTVGGPGALVASSSSVTLAAVTTPSSVLAAGRIDPPQAGPAEAVAVRDGVAYSTGYGYGLGVLDVHDAAAPRQVAHLKIEGISGLALAGTTAYLSGAMFHPVDIALPAAPVDLGMVPLEAWDRPRLAVAGPYVLVASNSASLAVVDVHDPRAPAIVPGGDPYLMLQDIAVDGTTAIGVHEQGGLTALDVSDPAHPALLGADSGITGVAVEVRGGFAYLAGPSGMTVADVSNPKAPSIVATLPWLGAPVYQCDIALGADTAYVLYGSDTIQVAAVDIRDPRSPRIVGRLDLGTPNDSYRSRSLAWSDGLLYLAGAGDGLWILRPVPTAPPGRLFLPAAYVR